MTRLFAPLMCSGAQRFHVKPEGVRKHPFNYNCSCNNQADPATIATRQQHKAQPTEEYAMRSKALTYSSTPDHDHHSLPTFERRLHDKTVRFNPTTSRVQQACPSELVWRLAIVPPSLKGQRHGVVGRETLFVVGS
jgi:hypothetical protein